MEILLIRHGSTEPGSLASYNAEKKRPDPKLDCPGTRQAELLGLRLVNSGVQKIYSSDLVRTLATAGVINSHLHVPLEVREELREIDMGRLHLCTWEDLALEDPTYCKAWHTHDEDLPYPGGESGADAARRAMKVLAEIAQSGLDRVAVVVHGGIIRVALCAVLGIGQQKRFLFGPPENTSISVIRYDREKKEFSVYSMNDASHLAQ
jgi:broad specificity phosphatase PhoE